MPRDVTSIRGAANTYRSVDMSSISPQLSLFDGKICPQCKTFKHASLYSKHARERDGLQSECKACHKARCIANRDRYRATSLEYKREHREELKEKQKVYNEANREKLRAGRIARYPARKAKVREYQKRHVAENAEAYREYYRNYRLKNLDLRRAYYREWRKHNPAIRKANDIKRRSRELNAAGSFTAQEWISLCEHFNHVCLCCGESKLLSADHIVPLSKGGSNFISNIQPLCRSCNSKKKTRTIDYRPNHEIPAISEGKSHSPSISSACQI